MQKRHLKAIESLAKVRKMTAQTAKFETAATKISETCQIKTKGFPKPQRIGKPLFNQSIKLTGVTND